MTLVLVRLVAWSCRRSAWVVAMALGMAISSGVYAAHHFQISTDMDALLDADLPWKLQLRQLEQAFPDQADDITVLVDGATPELAEQSAARLAEALRPQRDLFTSVERVNGGAFFDREGLLYSSLQEVRETTTGLIASQPLLARLAADPSLRGLLDSLALGLDAAQENRQWRAELQRAAAGALTVLGSVGSAQPRFLSWRDLLGGEAQNPADWRQFIEIVPQLDYTSAAPGAAATRAIRDTARRLQLDSVHGAHIRVTGSAPIADEELATLAESSGPIAPAMLVCMLAVLYLATRSVRAVAAILVTVLCGAIVTTALGLALLGQFSLISIAFLPLFVGLGIDFCIQLHARAAATPPAAATAERLTQATRGIGAGLMLAAAAIAAGFFAFLPTAYRGVSELGLIAGIGILIALVLCVTLLPALFCLSSVPLTGHRLPRRVQGAGVWLATRRRTLLAGAAVTALVALGALPWLAFDSDPMHLRNPHTEAVSAYYELAQDVDTTPDTVSVVTPDTASAVALAQRLRSLPEVGAALTLQSLVPEEQAGKLALIADARDLLGFSIDPFAARPPPTDADNVAALHQLSARLQTFTSGGPALLEQLRELARALDALAAMSSAERSYVAALLMQGLPTALAQIRSSLDAAPVTVDAVPPYLHRLWVGRNGRARVEVAPARPLLTMQETAAFVAAVRRVAPDAAGDAVTIVESGRSILRAFETAGVVSFAAIALLLLLVLRNLRKVLLVTAPILFAGALTFATCVAVQLPVNLENMIALPLLFGIGVAFNIYYVVAGHGDAPNLLESSLARGIVFSALTTGTSFAALMLSSHPGTASMGALLLIALLWIVVTSLLVTPALAGSLTGNADRSG